MKPVKTLQKLNSGEEVIIAALGDSLTYGWMTELGYLDYLKSMLKKKFPGSRFKLVNRGVPGDTASDGLRRVDNDVISLLPDLVLIQFALNDAYTDFTPEEFRKNIDSIISRIKDNSSSEIALLTSVALLDPYGKRIAQEFYKKILESGSENNIPVVSVHKYWEKKISSGVMHSLLVQGDGIHPTEKGYELMAEAVFELF